MGRRNVRLLRIEDFNFNWCLLCRTTSYCLSAKQCQLELDLEKGEALSEEGMEQAREAARAAEWLLSAHGLYADLRPGDRFSAITVSDAIGLPSAGEKRNNAMGGFFGSLVKAKRIKAVGMEKSERVPRHANKIMIWEKIW